MNLYRRLLIFLENIHVLIFKRSSGRKMREFAINLSWSLGGFFFSSFILFFLNVSAGRILGPVGYGKYNLILVLANIVSVVILLGLNTTTTKFLAESKNELEKKRILSNSIIIISITSLISLCLFLLMLFLDLFNGLNLNPNLFFTAIIFAILLSYKSLFDGIAKGLNLFEYQTKIRIAESLIVVIIFLLFFSQLKIGNFFYYAISLIGGMVFFCLFFYFKIKSYVIGWSMQHFKRIFKYTRDTIVITIILMIVNYLDRIFVGRFIGLTDLGIYSAYLTSSSVFVGQIMIVLNNVFFPAVILLEDKDAVKKQVDKLFIFFSIPVFFLFSIVSYGALYLFGNNFEKNILIIFAFSFASVLQLFGSLYKSLVSSHESKYGKYRKLSFTLPIFFIVFYGILVVFDLKNLNYATFAYVAFVSYNFTIIRLSCNYEKKKNI